MKKSTSKLILSRETIRVLSSAMMGRAHGGGGSYDRVCQGTTTACEPDPEPVPDTNTGYSGNTASAISRNVC